VEAFGGASCAIRRGLWSDYAGLREDAAAALAGRRGRPLRVVERDGEPLPHTDDFVEDRLNVAVEDGRVSRVLGTG
jgi:hypothetical protein